MRAWKDTSKSLDERIKEASRIIRFGSESENTKNSTTSSGLYFENHPTDSRVTGPCNVAETVAARYGTGGGNTPLILAPSQWGQECDAGKKMILGGETWETSKSSYMTHWTNEIASSLVATDFKRCAGDCDEDEYIVRRLTPTECARLQGFPDDWCADVPHTDAQEYKMWGNGIALNCILPMMQNIVRVLLK